MKSSTEQAVERLFAAGAAEAYKCMSIKCCPQVGEPVVLSTGETVDTSRV